MALTSDLIDQFNHDGFIVCRNMLSAKRTQAMRARVAAHLAQEIAPVEYEAELGYPGAPASLSAPGGRTIRRLRQAYQRDPLFQQWAADARLVDWLCQRFGEQVALTLAHHNCVMTKHPDFGTATGWHRDIRYWSFARSDLVTVWLALGEENETNGALRIIPGSHRLQLQPHQLDELDFLRPEVPENQALFAQGQCVHLQAGDALLFHSSLFHSASRNDGDTVKCSVAFAYRALSNAPLAGSRSASAGEVLLPAT